MKCNDCRHGNQGQAASPSWHGMVDEREISCRRCLPAHYPDIVLAWDCAWDPISNFSQDRPTILSSLTLPWVHPNIICLWWTDSLVCTLDFCSFFPVLYNLDDIPLLCSELRVDPVARPGWGGQWLTPVKVRVKQTQTASLTADSWQPGNRNCRTEMGCLREHPHRIQDHLTLTSNICRWDELWQDWSRAYAMHYTSILEIIHIHTSKCVYFKSGNWQCHCNTQGNIHALTRERQRNLYMVTHI